MEIREIREKLDQAEKILVGLGGEWQMRPPAGSSLRRCRLADPEQSQLKAAYESLARLLSGRDYYIAATAVDGAVREAGFDESRITAPCGNVHWRQCSKACTKDIWEEGEVPEDICPHCGAPLTGNTIEAENYIEEGYLPSWEAYKKWQAAALNHRLLILELGEGFDMPAVLRWPFEKNVYFNKKAFLCRVNERFYQIPKEIGERGAGIAMDSREFVRELEAAGGQA